MSTIVTQVAGTIQTVLSTELNSLADGAMALGSEITPTSAGYQRAEVQLDATFAAAPAANSAVQVWFLRAIDGTNYEDGGTTLAPARGPDLVIEANAAQAGTRNTKASFPRPGKYKVLLKNATGQAMAASGNTLKVLPNTPQNG